MATNRRVGAGAFGYDEVKYWGRFPAGCEFCDVPDVAIDSQNRVYALSRGETPVLVFDSTGNFVRAWGKGIIKRPHGIFIGPDDSVYCADDVGHALHKFTADGKLLMSINPGGRPSETGYEWGKPETIARAAGPFNFPTAVALSSEGEIYVADGYGNARVHKFSPDGRLLFSWGEPGEGPGQFINPHGLLVDDGGRVYVCDRFNARIQIFDSAGKFITQWQDFRWPDKMCTDRDGNLYIVELGFVFLKGPKPIPGRSAAARVTVRNRDGETMTEWEEIDSSRDGRFFAPHGIAIDSKGDLYVSEVPVTYCGGTAPSDWPILRKYIRRSNVMQ